MEKIIGVYKITIKNHVYIGSSSNINRRLWEHFWKLKNNKHVNKHFQNIFNKYKNLESEILEYCKIEELLEKEQYYIDLLKPDINKSPISGTTLGLKLTPEQCLNRKLNNLGRKHSKESIEKRVSKIRGRKYSKEHRENISKSKKGKSISEIHKLALMKNNKKPVVSYTKTGDLVKIYECAKHTLVDGFTPTNVTCCCKNKLKAHKNLIWKYYEKC